MKRNTKNLFIIFSLILTVCICFGGCEPQETESAVNSSVKAPVASGNSVFDANPDASKETTTSSDVSSDNDSSQTIPSDEPSSDSSSPSSESETATTTRVEKIVKTYPFEDEFYPPLYDKLSFYDKKSGKTIPYSFFLPENYSKSKKYPVLFLLHGLGACGNDYVSATSEFGTLFKYNADIVNNSIIIVPQCPDGGWWSIDEYGNEDGWLGAAMHLLYNIESTYSCDMNRIYVMGLSMGGQATWAVLERYSDHFAAGVPICGWGNPQEADRLAKIPIWIYHGTADATVGIESSEEMYDAIIAAGGHKIHFTRLNGVGHDSWIQACQSRELLSWMFSQNKSTNPNATYSIIPYMRVVDSNGKTVITELDATDISLRSVSSTEQLEFTLSADGVKKLATAYQKSGGKKFDVYYGNKKILTFTATKKPSDNLFVIQEVFDSTNYWWYYNRMASLI